MAIVTSTFSTNANQVWASTTWSIANDLSGKLHTELSNWVTAINDTNLIEIKANPGNATSRATTQYVTWRLGMRSPGDESTDYGILFKGRYAGTGSTSASGFVGTYNNWISSTSNNGYGTYNTISDSNSNEAFTSAGTAFIAYEATGSNQWFSYAWENSARTARRWDCLLRTNTSNMISGSYYPSSGLGEWIYVRSNGNDAFCNTPQNSVSNAPFKGINTSANNKLNCPTPTFAGYFFRLAAQYGDLHYLGDVTNDILISTTTTGQFGDTVTIDSNPYTCIGNMALSANLWIRTA